MMKRFDKLLENEVSGYKGEFGDIISQAPALYRLMTRLLDDPDLPRDMSQMVIAAIAYFILPEDAIPEDKYGPMGFIDDIYLCAFVADKVMQAAGKEEILVRNWDGEMPVVPLVKGILAREKELLGDKKGRIMELIGYGQESEI
ncbi:MAG TPA: DUF1232 domain-containing protein [Methanotrichaceae archaeon]|nr:DUF1232 domain-containing protein [Methanotrichaceae archaeon]